MTQTLRDKVLPPINQARGIMGRLGFRPYTFAVIRRVWSGRSVGTGSAQDTRLAIAPDYKIRLVSLQEVTSDAGTLRDGDWRIGPLTPAVAVIKGHVKQIGTGTGTVAVSQSVLPTGVTQGKWRLVVEITTSGPVGTGAFRYSADGGTTFSTPAAIAATFQIASIGVLLTFSGTFVLGDTYSVKGVSVGYTPQQLRPSTVLDNIQTFYELVGPEGTLLCTLVRYDTDRALRNTLYVRRTRLTP